MWKGSVAVLVAVGGLVPAAGAIDAASDAGNAASFPKSFTGTITWHHDRMYEWGFETWEWTTKITLRRTGIYPAGAGYEGSSTAQVEMTGRFRTCTYRVPPTPAPMEWNIEISDSRESPTGYTYHLHGGSPIQELPFQERCDVPGTPRTSIRTLLGWDETPVPYRGPTIVGQRDVRIEGEHDVRTWNLVGQEEPSCEQPRARATATTGPRAGHFTLNGSASAPRKCIHAYKWALEPGEDCPPGTRLVNSTKSGPMPTVVALCSLGATLTVFGEKGRRAVASTVVSVLPRTDGFRTPDVMHREKRTEDSRINDPPFAHPGEDYGDKNGGIVIGLNVSACRDQSRGAPFLCPDVPGGSGLGKRYTLATVHDPGGPFNGFSYVASAPLTIERLGILNYWFLPGGPIVAPGQPNFYDYNKARGADVDGFIAAAAAHEGMGLGGRLSTGHSGRLQAHISVPDREFDPRRTLEAMFHRKRNTLRDDIDRELSSISAVLATGTRDPLPEIWSGKLWLYDPELQQWFEDDWVIGPSDKQ